MGARGVPADGRPTRRADVCRRRRRRNAMRTAWVLTLAVLLSGCATTYHSPGGSVWGYTGESAAYPGLRSIGYSPTPRACKEQHAQDRDKPELAPAHYTLSECRELVITAGAEYWAFSVNEFNSGSGTTSRRQCEVDRHYVQSYGGTPSACSPIGVRFR